MAPPRRRAAKRDGAGGLLRLFLAAAAGATVCLVAYSVARDRAAAPGPGPALRRARGSPGKTRGAEAADGPPRFWAPTEVSGVERGDPRVTLCKLAFDTYWKAPSKTPMFRDLVAASKCGRGKAGTLNELHADLAAKGITPLKPSGFVFHESRVGSTLVANMLASVPTHVVYSESAPLPVVLNHCRSCDADRKRDLIRKIVDLMGASPRYHTRLFFKFQSITVPNMRVLLDAFPDTPWIFVYRDPVQTMMSHFKNGLGNGPCLRAQRHPPPATLAVLGMDAAHASKSKKEDYCAAHLAMLTNAALAANDASPKGLLVDYASMPGSILGYVIPRHFDVALAPEDARRAYVASGTYSKARGSGSTGKWAGDNEQKEKAATDAIRAAAGAYLRPTYDRAKAATLARTDGDDLLRFKDFAPPDR